MRWTSVEVEDCKVEGVQGNISVEGVQGKARRKCWGPRKSRFELLLSCHLGSYLSFLPPVGSEGPFQQMSILRTRLCWQYDWTIMRHLSWVSNEVPRLSILLDNHQLRAHGRAVGQSFQFYWTINSWGRAHGRACECCGTVCCITQSIHSAKKYQ